LGSLVYPLQNDRAFYKGKKVLVAGIKMGQCALPHSI